MKYLAFIFTFVFAWSALAELDVESEKKAKLIKNVEIQATYVKDNKNYIYMDTDSERLKVKKAELTKDGVKQILKNKESKLTLFIPERSIVNRTPIKPKEEAE